ncbi:MAG: YHS domain-containing protein [Balneola sp.]|jgi:YHS domain-containing protein|nr:YHS domain-containing protein [Balneola sp.]MBE78348.1 YHS domain-containing protein [Balneola sp.]|tara:strand:+ start:53711 stop:53902 length:192 start_codon:yes stop_codon:yes gene_type:complete
MEDTMKAQNICPVMGHEIEDPTSAPSSEYKGTTYYFCCENCKTTFDENPADFIGSNGSHHHHH